jgi:hypothetical protein
LGHAGQGHWEVVGHDDLIPSYNEDLGGVDLQELGGVDTPILFLQQVGPQLAWPDHHVEVWGKRHAATPRSRGCRGVSNLLDRGGVHRTKVPVDVAAPLPVVLNDDATVLT